MLGKFVRLFGPLSPSPESLAVTPSSLRSMPSRVWEWIELPRMELPVPADGNSTTPAPALYAMTLAAPGAVPPIVLFAPAAVIDTPLKLLGTADVPEAV